MQALKSQKFWADRGQVRSTTQTRRSLRRYAAAPDPRLPAAAFRRIYGKEPQRPKVGGREAVREKGLELSAIRA